MAKKEKTLTVMFDEDNYQYYLSLIKQIGCPYKIARSTYTLTISSECVNIKFIQNMQTQRAFIAGNMIKADIKDKPRPIVPDLKYFDFNKDSILMKAKNKQVYNIDIKSAYANALKNNGYISDRTFSMLASLSKRDRLASVGMLASKKCWSEYDGTGNAVKYYEEVAPTSSFFFFCVHAINVIMDEIKQAIGDDFLFYWVDGIFFTGDRVQQIEQILFNKGYPFSFCKIDNLEIVQTNKVRTLIYTKEQEKKTLSLPNYNKKRLRYLIEYQKQL